MAPGTKFVMYATEGKDLSVWDDNRDTFRQLYLVDKKSLKQVKEVMETQHGFPETSLSQYEVNLREHLKLRKNVKKSDWVHIGARLQKRKREGEEFTIVFGGTAMDSESVKRRIRRAVSGTTPLRFASSPLPIGLQIVPDLPRGGSLHSSALIVHEPQHPPVATPIAFRHSIPLTNTMRPEGWSHNCLRVQLPFNHFLATLTDLHRFRVEPQRGQSSFPLSAQVDIFHILAEVYFLVSNSLDGNNESCDKLLGWIGRRQNKSVLRAFFSIQSRGVLAVWQELLERVSEGKHGAAFVALFQIAQNLNFALETFTFRHVHDTARQLKTFLGVAVMYGTAIAGHIAKELLESGVSPNGFKTIGFGRRGVKVDSLLHLATERRDSAMIHLLLQHNARVDKGWSPTIFSSFRLSPCPYNQRFDELRSRISCEGDSSLSRCLQILSDSAFSVDALDRPRDLCGEELSFPPHLGEWL